MTTTCPLPKPTALAAEAGPTPPTGAGPRALWGLATLAGANAGAEAAHTAVAGAAPTIRASRARRSPSVPGKGRRLQLLVSI